MPISIGEKLPDASFMIMGDDGPEPVVTSDIFAGKKVALFAVPGAFTPTCSNEHLPGFVEALDDIKRKGIDTVACVAVNDVFVMDAWAKASGANGKILFLADGNGVFTRSIGMELDVAAVGLGQRSQRYAMLVDDGVVEVLNLESAPASAIISSAESLLRVI